MSIENQEANSITIYPNPAEQFIKIDGIDKAANVGLFNIAGQRVKSFSVQKNGELLNIGELKAGLYFVQINEAKAIKFIKK
jgi:membrane protease subunit (stomatin/prohibitin family)